MERLEAFEAMLADLTRQAAWEKETDGTAEGSRQREICYLPSVFWETG